MLSPFPLVGRVIARARDSGHTPPAREGMVHSLTSSTDRTTTRPALVGQSAPAASLQPHPPRRPLAEPSRVATLKRHLQKSGFLRRASRVLSRCLRSSTSRLYQSRWQIFCGWCCGRGVAPVNAAVPVIVDFLIHLRHGKGLSVCAVKGYSSALILAPEDNTTCLRALRYGTACSCPSSLGDSWYCSVSSFHKELRCRPGVEGGYLAQASHLYAPLLEGLCPSVP